MAFIVGANLVLRFLLELGSLVSLAAWGFHTGDSTVADVLLSVGAPLAAALLWWAFIAPKARFHVDLRVRFVLESLVFGAAFAALAAAGRTTLALAFGAAVVVSETVLYGLDYPRARG